MRNWKVVFEAERCPVRLIPGHKDATCFISGEYCATEEADCPARMFSQFEGDEPYIIDLFTKRLEVGHEDYGPFDCENDERDMPYEALEEILDVVVYLCAHNKRLRADLDKAYALLGKLTESILKESEIPKLSEMRGVLKGAERYDEKD